MGITDKTRFLSSLDNDHIIKFAHIYDLAQKSDKHNISVYGDFLSENSASELLHRAHFLPCMPTLFGGFDDAERKMVAFVSDYDEPLFPISVLKIRSAHLKNLTHRDFLGSIMGLGIKREKCGDIIIGEDLCQILLSDEIASYVCSSLEKVGREGVKTELSPLTSLIVPEKKVRPVTGTVSSLRLDAVISVLTGKGRAKSSEYIKAGLVFVNGKNVLKGDMHLSGGETISVRSFGKATLSVGGHSKKDRIFITLNVFS